MRILVCLIGLSLMIISCGKEADTVKPEIKVLTPSKVNDTVKSAPDSVLIAYTVTDNVGLMECHSSINDTFNNQFLYISGLTGDQSLTHKRWVKLPNTADITPYDIYIKVYDQAKNYSIVKQRFYAK